MVKGCGIMTKVAQALMNIICNWEYQKESCDILFPTTAEYSLAYGKLTGLRQALDEFRSAGLVTYNNDKWEVVEHDQ
jgi:hypothetical protein